MKVDYPDDLDGRMINCADRAKMLQDTLQAIARSELQAPDRDTLYALGSVAGELAIELADVNQALTDLEGPRAPKGKARQRRLGVRAVTRIHGDALTQQLLRTPGRQP